MTQPRSKIQITFADVTEPAPGEPELGLRGPWWAWAVLLLIISMGSFSPVLSGTFLPQDDANVTANPFLRAWAGLPGIWRFSYNLPQVSPLGYSLFMLEFRIWGHIAKHAAGGYHLVSLLMHAANVLLLWTLLRKLDLRGAVVAAAIFAAHPVQVQSVAWISQQPTLLGMMLALGSLIVYLRFCGVNPEPYEPSMLRLPQARWLLYSISLVLFLLAILAKPLFAAVPLLVIVIVWWERGRLAKDDWAPLLPMLVLMLLTFVGGVLVFRHRLDITEQNISVLHRILIVGPAIFFYLYELIRPGTHSFVYTRWNPTSWWAVLMLAAVACSTAALWIRRSRIGRGPLACVLLFLILLVPQILFLDVVQLRDSFVADSVMYAPAIALILPVCAMLAGWLAPRGHEISARSAPPWIAAAAVLLAMGASFWQVRAYRSAELLWADAIQRSPRSVYALNQLGLLELSRKLPAAALAHFTRALELDPSDPATHRNLGSYYESVSEPDRAYGQYTAAVKFRTDDLDARCGLARMLAAQGNTTAALDQYQRVLEIRREYEVALNDLALLYVARGEYQQALEYYQRGIRAAPRYLPLRVNLANLYYRLGNSDGVIREANTAVELQPDDYTIHVNFGAMCGEMATVENDPKQKKALLERSEMEFRVAIYLQSDSAPAAHNLAIALARQADMDPVANAGKRREAVFYFSKACQLDPANVEFRQHLEMAREQAARAPS